MAVLRTYGFWLFQVGVVVAIYAIYSKYPRYERPYSLNLFSIILGTIYGAISILIFARWAEKREKTLLYKALFLLVVAFLTSVASFS